MLLANARPGIGRSLLAGALIVALGSIAAAGLSTRPAAKDVATSRAACPTPDHGEVRIPGGTFLMGSNPYYREEGPVRRVAVPSFSIDRYAVTNAEFARFVAATRYTTDAERKPDPRDYPEIPAEKLAAGGAIFMAPDGKRHADETMSWWQFVAGADWRHPEGPGSSIRGRDNYPVVQISYADALAYAHWLGRALPTEAQFEFAARGGLDGKTYAWGDQMSPQGQAMANTWQGEFPDRNTAADGFGGVAPVGCFPPNGYGLYDMIGNVWEWTSTPYEAGESSAPASRVLRTIKGGSFLCAPNFCRRYRPAARQPQESGFSAVHLGFRTVRKE